MGGSMFGGALRVTTFGESHGPAVGAVVDGCPAGLSPGGGGTPRGPGPPPAPRAAPAHPRRGAAPRTRNTDARSRDYESIKALFRPGHADYTYHQKYGIRDYRGGGRASARETAARVAAGAVARELLGREGIEVYAYLLQMGNVRAKRVDRTAIDGNPFFAPDPDIVPEMEKLLDDIRSSKDSIGALVEVVAEGVPPGLGEPVFDKLSADLCKGLGSIPAVKGVGIGAVPIAEAMVLLVLADHWLRNRGSRL